MYIERLSIENVYFYNTNEFQEIVMSISSEIEETLHKFPEAENLHCCYEFFRLELQFHQNIIENLEKKFLNVNVILQLPIESFRK